MQHSSSFWTLSQLRTVARTIAFLGALALGGTASHGQVAAGYAFSQTPGTFTLNVGTGTVLWSNGFFGAFDDNVSGAITIPSFSFNGTAYTQLFVSSQGFITFGSAPATTNYTPLSSTAASAQAQEPTTSVVQR